MNAHNSGWIGQLDRDPAELALLVKRRVRQCQMDYACLVWSEHGDVFAQTITARAARRVEELKPELIIGLYTPDISVKHLQGDIEAMQHETIKH